MRTSIGLIVLTSLLAAGCSSEEATDAPAGRTGSQVTGGGMSGGMGGMGGMGTGAMGAGMTAPPKPYVPKREPVFDFTAGGPIADDALGNYHVSMACTVGGEDVGTMTFELWPDAAPKTVRRFLRYCDEGFYDGLGFHRIVRQVMIQGGDPNGNGSGGGPHGAIPGEFSKDPKYAHRYGVLSMARGEQPNSASCQFFILTDEGPDVWGMDGRFASFGRLTTGVSTLEALADVPVGYGPQGEPSAPSQKVVMTRVEVVEGEAPRGEEIARPPVEVDLAGEPEHVTLQHVLISFDGVQGLDATRTQEEAEALANQVLEQARSGADFQALVLEHSDDPVREGNPKPGVYQMLNNGVRNREAERRMFDLEQGYNAKIAALQAQVADGSLDAAGMEEKVKALNLETGLAAEADQWVPRQGFVPAFGNVGFSLGVGEVGMAAFDAEHSPFGWHIIKRLE